MQVCCGQQPGKCDGGYLSARLTKLPSTVVADTVQEAMSPAQAAEEAFTRG